MESFIPALFGFLGALIGSASAIAALYLGHRLNVQSELAKHRRAKGEAAIADLAELSIWAGNVINTSLHGELDVHLPKQIFNVESYVALYFSNYSHHTRPLAKEAVEFAGAAALVSTEIKRGKLIGEKANELAARAQPFIQIVETLRAAIISELRE